MSSKAVRDLFEAEFNTLAVPYYLTTNTQQNPDDPVWFSAEFYSDFVTQDCFGGNNSVERGTVDIQIFTPAGGGPDSALNFAGQIVEHFRAWRKGELEVFDFIPANETGSGAAESRWYGVTVNLEYNFRF